MHRSSVRDDGTWMVMFCNESEALLDCDIKLGIYGDDTREFIRVKNKKQYNVDLIIKETYGDRTTTRLAGLESIIEPYIFGNFLFYRPLDDMSHSVTGFPLRNVTSIKAAAYIVPIERKRFNGVDVELAADSSKGDILYIYREGDRILDRYWRLGAGDTDVPY